MEDIKNLIEDGNEFILTINMNELKNKRVKIYKKGIGEVGSLSNDEIFLYLNNEINNNMINNIKVSICNNHLVGTYMEFCIKNNIKLENSGAHEMLKRFALDKVIEQFNIDSNKIISSNISAQCCENWNVEISYYL